MTIIILVFFAGLVLFHTLERIVPIRTEYLHPDLRPRRGYFADLMAAFVNGPALSGVTKIGATGLIFLLPPTVQWIGKWPWWAQFLTFFLVNDFARYWLHRWYHISDTLWRIHRVHHTVTEMDCLSLFRIHILEAVIKNFAVVLPFRVMGIDDTAIIAYTCWDITKGFWHHANFRSRVGPLNYIFNSPELHWWHHSTEARGQYANFGSILSIWDWLFGTALYLPGEWPKTIGVDGMEGFPDTYAGQLTSIRFSDDEVRANYPPKSASAPDLPDAATPDAGELAQA